MSMLPAPVATGAERPAVQFRLLGPVELVVAGRPLPLGPPKRRAVLAALLIDAGSPVAATTLIERVWGENPPPKVDAALHSYVARLRQVLAGIGEVRLERAPGGYLLRVDPELIDLYRAHRLIDRAGAPGCAVQERSTLLREALRGWREPALSGLAGTWAEQVRESLAQRRLATSMQWAESELELGRTDPAIHELGVAVARHPLVEPLVALRMRALFQAGRAAEALACYAAARRRLVEELGTEPGAELRALHGSLLRGTVPLPRPVGRLVRPGALTPQQLPADIAAFTGRRAELTRLDELVARRQPACPVVVSGTAGLGKTALAVRWAHRVCDQFPDGQLYVDLRGYGPDPPVPAGEALARFLRALGVDGSAVPVETEERAALYRTLAADRRLLVILDNAATAAQVRPLLPGGPSCAAVVTSRDSLAGLVARDGAYRLALDQLPDADGVELLATLAPSRVRTGSEVVAALVQRCAGLPLAVRVLAEHLVANPHVPLFEVVQQVTDEGRRLDLLDADGEGSTSLRAVFSWSYRALTLAQAQAFRLLGLNPGPDIGRSAAAALLDTPPSQGDRLVDALVRAHLVRETRPGVFSMHDLLRAYARERAGEMAPAEQAAAVCRLIEHYLANAAQAVALLTPAEPTGSAVRQDVGTPGFPDATAARMWLDANQPNLVAAVTRAAQHAPARAVQLATTLFPYFQAGAYQEAAKAVHESAVSAAAAAGDPAGEATARRQLSVVYGRLGRYREAVEQAQRSRAICHELGNRAGVARALGCLGAYLWQLGQYADAVTHTTAAADTFADLGDRDRVAIALSNLAGLCVAVGRYDEAIGHAQPALEIFTASGDLSGLGRTLGNLGQAYQHLGRYEQALDHSERALAAFREGGFRGFVSQARSRLANLYRLLGRSAEAVEAASQALAEVREIGDRDGEAEALDALGRALSTTGHTAQGAAHHRMSFDLAVATGNRSRQASALTGLADALRASGQLPEARTHQTAALDIARDIGDRLAEARALDGLARIAHAAGDLAGAETRWRECLRRYAELSVPDADEVRARLADLAPAVPRP